MATTIATTPPVMMDVEAAGESTPLLLDSTSTTTTPHEAPPPLQDLKAESLKERTVSAVAAVNFFLSIFTLVFQAAVHPVVWISGMLGLLVSPLAALQQHKLTQVEALAQTNERLELEVDTLSANNTRLTSQLQQTEESVYNLQAMQQTLETLQAVQGQSMDQLEEQLTTSREILGTMSTNYKGQLLQNLITVLLGADQDGNMILSDEDIEDIIRRLEGLHNVNIDDDKLRQVIIEHGRSVEAVMQVAKSALLTEQAHDPNNSAVADIFSFLEPDEEEQE